MALLTRRRYNPLTLPATIVATSLWVDSADKALALRVLSQLADVVSADVAQTLPGLVRLEVIAAAAEAPDKDRLFKTVESALLAVGIEPAR